MSLLVHTHISKWISKQRKGRNDYRHIPDGVVGGATADAPLLSLGDLPTLNNTVCYLCPVTPGLTEGTLEEFAEGDFHVPSVFPRVRMVVWALLCAGLCDVWGGP